MPHDVARIVQLHEGQPTSVRVLVPVDTEANRLVEAIDDVALGHLRDAVTGDHRDPEAAHRNAEQALTASVTDLVQAGLDASGALVGDDPVDEVVAAAQDLHADEVLVVTDPHLLAETFRRDWASRIRAASHRPVLHFVAGTDRVVG